MLAYGGVCVCVWMCVCFYSYVSVFVHLKYEKWH